MVVWECWTTKKWWDEGNPNPKLQGLTTYKRERGKAPPQQTKTNISIFYPIYSSIYEIYLRETGYMGNPAFHRKGKIPPGLEKLFWRSLEIAGDGWRFLEER